MNWVARAPRLRSSTVSAPCTSPSYLMMRSWTSPLPGTGWNFPSANAGDAREMTAAATNSGTARMSLLTHEPPPRSAPRHQPDQRRDQRRGTMPRRAAGAAVGRQGRAGPHECAHGAVEAGDVEDAVAADGARGDGRAQDRHAELGRPALSAVAGAQRAQGAAVARRP